MKSKGMLHYVYSALRDRNLSREDVSKIQKERLKELVRFARENSPYTRICTKIWAVILTYRSFL